MYTSSRIMPDVPQEQCVSLLEWCLCVPQEKCIYLPELCFDVPLAQQCVSLLYALMDHNNDMYLILKDALIYCKINAYLF